MGGAEAADSPAGVAAGGILPRPVSIDMKDGRQACFDIAKGHIRVIFRSPGLRARPHFGIYGQPLWWLADSPVGKSRGRIEFSIVDSLPGDSSPEGYVLDIAGDGVHARATSAAGLCFMPRILSHSLPTPMMARYLNAASWTIRAFQYRGLMIDVSRNFRDKNFIKKQIDAMAALKLNRLHLHLTDAAGWRMQIDRYPRLTEVCRVAQGWLVEKLGQQILRGYRP